MAVSPEQMRKIEKFAFEKTKKQDYNHDKNHVVRTVKLALFLAKKEGADEEVCHVAALLHDIAKGDEPHAKKGAKLATAFLKKLKLPPGFIQRADHAIKCHSEEDIKKAKTLEAKVLFDADTLQIIGPYSFCRVFSDLIAFKKLNLKAAMKVTAGVQNGCFNMLQTNTAKKIMRKDHEFMKEFYRLYDKWDKVRL